MKVRFETFGCRLNRAEALDEEARYIADGWQVTGHRSDADLIVVRGCSVTRRAERDTLKLIEHLKEKYPAAKIRVTGCIGKREQDILASKTTEATPLRTSRAYLKVQDGCSGKCTFCIVPKFRGPSVSVDFEKVMDKAKRFIEAGYREIVVTGCNLSLYASCSKRLPDLLSSLAALAPRSQDEPFRIRIGSLEPGICDMECVSVMASNPNICRFLHIPVQSGSPQILAAMKRPYLVRDVDNLVKAAVKAMPLISVGCDLMTGFPGEMDIDFQATLSLLKRLNFSNAHIFPYSERPGTLASQMGGALPREIRIERARLLSSFAMAQRKRYAKKFIGRKVEVVIEDEKECSGWTGEYLRFKSAGAGFGNSFKRKGLYGFVVTEVKDDVLKGRPLR